MEKDASFLRGVAIQEPPVVESSLKPAGFQCSPTGAPALASLPGEVHAHLARVGPCTGSGVATVPATAVPVRE
jgi:hypothetical protein